MVETGHVEAIINFYILFIKFYKFYVTEWQLKWKLTIRYLDKSLEDDELEFTDRDLAEKYMQEFNHQESVAYAKLDKC